MSRLDLVVGPNGAGKTTFVQLVIAPTLPKSVFVNADVIAAERWPHDPAGNAYQAATIAESTRLRLIERGIPLIAETVFSHESKLDLIRAAITAGFEVALHVVMVPEELAVRRVGYRVAAGGHDVPVDKIRSRHQRLWRLIVEGVTLSSTATFWDNSAFDGPQIVALFVGGFPVGSPAWPGWTPTVLTGHRW